METWYVMEDGSCGDPRDIAPDANGVLRHKDGRAVKYAPHGPRSRGVNPDDERAKGAPKPVVPMVNREVTAEAPKRTYKTRGSK
jgi:hypothetical protein